MQPLLSKKTIHELQEYFVNTTLREITEELDNADVLCDQEFVPAVSGERRRLFQQYFHTLDLTKPRDVRKVLVVFENVFAILETIRENPVHFNHEWATKKFDLFVRLLKRDGYSYVDGKLVSSAGHTGLDELQDTISPLDAPHLQTQIDRVRDAIDDDPWLAIGTAKEMVETVCKTILRERGVSISKNPEIPELIRAVRESLQLLPEQIPSTAKAADTIRRLLSNLGTIAQNLAELRRDYGTGHGADGKAKGLEARHARLAVNAALTLVTFFIETHHAR